MKMTLEDVHKLAPGDLLLQVKDRIHYEPEIVLLWPYCQELPLNTRLGLVVIQVDDTVGAYQSDIGRLFEVIDIRGGDSRVMLKCLSRRAIIGCTAEYYRSNYRAATTAEVRVAAKTLLSQSSRPT